MDALIFLVVLCVLAAFVAAPLYRSGPPSPDDPALELEARRDALYGALRDLELDRASDLLDAGEYERQRSATTDELVGVLARLDRAAGTIPGEGGTRGGRTPRD